MLDTGPELLTGSTRLKAGSATKLALNIITTSTFVRLGKVYSNLMVDLKATNDKLTDRAIRILRELCPKLSRPEAATVLDRAGGRLKAASSCNGGAWTSPRRNHFSPSTMAGSQVDGRRHAGCVRSSSDYFERSGAASGRTLARARGGEFDPPPLSGCLPPRSLV